MFHVGNYVSYLLGKWYLHILCQHFSYISVFTNKIENNTNLIIHF
jgi:hypothetical protein